VHKTYEICGWRDGDVTVSFLATDFSEAYVVMRRLSRSQEGSVVSSFNKNSTSTTSLH
jgi:hypothetical protein